MTKTAWIFPGQGSQAVGMGADLSEHPLAAARFDTATQVLGWSVPEICHGDEAQLGRTLYTQPCLYVVESILAEIMRDRGHDAPALVAGHSLGEYVALYVAGVFDFKTGLELVKRRAELMDGAAGGQMAALIGFDRDGLAAAIEQNPDVVLANDNSRAQVVISGTPDAVEAILANVKAKRAVKLNVSGAFHSPMMAEAAAEFQEVLDRVPFRDAAIPVLSNTDPTPATDAAQLKERLARQMTGSVRWREIGEQLPECGIEAAIEVGPGKVLSGLLKRSGLSLQQVGSLADLGSA
jgi:[acyl-carrier-protein] S-malonyltransferase